MLNIWCHFNDTLENEKAENFDWVSKVLTGQKKSISQPKFCSIPSLNGKSGKKSQMFFKIVFTELSSIVGLYCLEKVSTIWWAQSDHACLALLARFTLLLVKKREKVTFVLQAKRGVPLPFGDGAARSLGAIQRFKVPRATPRTPPRTTIKCEIAFYVVCANNTKIWTGWMIIIKAKPKTKSVDLPITCRGHSYQA